jgi:hypothetical protein
MTFYLQLITSTKPYKRIYPDKDIFGDYWDISLSDINILIL